MKMVTVVEFLKDKFNPTRPMGRKNFFWTNFVYRAIFIALISLSYLLGVGLAISIHFPLLLLILIDAPCLLLAFRRARAAKVHFSLIYIAGITSLVYALLSRSIPLVPNLIVGYNIGLSIALVILKNKVDPLSP